MELLDTLVVKHSSENRRIELLWGDLARIPRRHSVDVLVVSAFRGDFLPTPTSLIGALYQSGVSVEALADNMKVDLREQFSCWLSQALSDHFSYRHILCIESGWRGEPPDIIDDLFRSLAPFLVADFPNASVATPIIGAGDQGHPPEKMLETMVGAAISWMNRGLPLKTLKIVAHTRDIAERVSIPFAVIKRGLVERSPRLASPAQQIEGHDVFVSYSHRESEVADYVVDKLNASPFNLKIFFDRTSLRPGNGWTWDLANALDASKKVIALYSKDYWASKNCQLEFIAAFNRQNDTRMNIIFPIYLSESQIPYMFKTVQYVDCRVVDRKKIGLACANFLSTLKD